MSGYVIVCCERDYYNPNIHKPLLIRPTYDVVRGMLSVQSVDL